MAKIKDRITLGIISSLIATVPATIMDLFANKTGLSDYYYNHASTLFIKRSKSNTLRGKIVSALVNNITNCTTGVATSYVLSATGRDKPILKGIGVYALSWLSLNGLLYKEVLDTKARRAHTPIFSFFIHTVAGSICGYCVSKMGDDSLFPDSKINSKTKLPLVGSNSCNKATADIPSLDVKTN
ncbi:hypothetical protein Desor_2736 [Desulfosporosinus orientis DSM 765]|uniref:Uncharacterized protein n=1 Tax=Desulfosporosinus orientis (strain ATCC 19365 / DSM 765 / NCIMB 8382 / VKM B-1628 / Singapore I) TaxID=768706 RepID=G7WBE8_DESOD|nr:hypothetical protein [Desulfosporosinus orientis]AET68277.1 hypothetical protein Desor_2736 [Desulfosporosinus orientis DSM 765]